MFHDDWDKEKNLVTSEVLEEIKQSTKFSKEFILENEMKVLLLEEEARKKKFLSQQVEFERIQHEKFKSRMEKIKSEIEIEKLKKKLKENQILSFKIQQKELQNEAESIRNAKEFALMQLREKAKIMNQDDEKIASNYGSAEINDYEVNVEMQKLKDAKEKIFKDKEELTRIIDLLDVDVDL